MADPDLPRPTASTDERPPVPSPLGVVGEQPGDLIGPYRLLEVIGTGGFGVVFCAERREPMIQRVALKVIKPGMDSGRVLARFEAERQALALMNHRNVAKVLDAGATPRGLPYFAMELVHGTPITEYSDCHRLTVDQRLELFTQVCDAVRHAHAKGVIHRDLKPSNVLVAIEQEMRPVVKVIDFGIAKALNQKLTDHTIFTHRGELIGTPEYMSPEQAEMSSEDIDTRTDIYSLGVMLYELLTGALPFDAETLRHAALAELYRIIREVEPPRPSKRLTSMEDAEAVAARRQTTTPELQSRLHRELEWIPLKAIRKNREERYPTAEALADDVRRYLRGEPLVAAPESRAYRLRKFVSRHRREVLVASALFTVIVAGTVTSTIGFVRATRKSADAQRESIAARKAEGTARDAESAAKESARAANVSAYIANIALAKSGIDAWDMAGARNALAKCREDLRGWEWGFLDAATDRSIGGFTAHGDRLRAMEFSPDGSKLATCCVDGTARIWDYVSGDLLADLDVRRSPVNGLAWSPDSTRVATATCDGFVRTWTTAGAPIASAQIGSDYPTGIAWSPAGTVLATVHRDGRLTLIEPDRLVPVGSIAAHKGLTIQVCFSHDGTRVYSGGFDDNHVRAFDVRTQDNVWDVDAGCGIWSLASARNADVIAGAGGIGAFTMPGAHPTGVDFIRDYAHPFTSSSACLTPDGRTLAIGGREAVGLFDVGTRQPLRHKPSERTFQPKVAIHPSGAVVARGDDAGRVRFWHVAAQQSLPISWNPLAVDVALVPPASAALDAGLFAVGRRDGQVVLLDLNDAARTRTLKDHVGAVVGVALSPDVQFLVTTAEDKRIVLRAAPFDGTPTVLAPGPVLGPVAIAADAKAIAVGTADGPILLVDPAGAPARVLAGHSGPVYALSLSPDASRLVSAGYDMTVRLWDVHSGQCLASVAPHAQPVLDLCFSRDGTRVATSSMDTTAAILDSSTLATIRTFRGHLRTVTSAAFSPDGSRLVTASWDQTLRFWMVSSGEEVFQHSAGNWFTKVAFAPDASRIALLTSVPGVEDLTLVSPVERVTNDLLPSVRARLNAGATMRSIYDAESSRRGDGTVREGMWWTEVMLTLQRKLSSEAETAAALATSKTYPDDSAAEAAVAQLASSADLSPSIRDRAARIARDRLMSPGERRSRLRRQLLDPNTTRAVASSTLEMVNALYENVHSPQDLSLRGIAEYRAGQFARAASDLKAAAAQRLATAASIVSVLQAENNRDDPIQLAFLAMSLLADGQTTAAGETMDRLDHLMATIGFTDEDSKLVYAEARTAFGR